MRTREADRSVVWRRLDRPGHESARVSLRDSGWSLTGTAVFAQDEQPCRLDYQVLCDSNWLTSSGSVSGRVGDETVAFSPSTNLLPIRRLGLGVGEEATVQAAWLRFPSFRLEPLEQLYRRIDVATYRYQSAGGKFSAELQVNEAGFVTRYPDFWQAEGSG